jgi:hypothetical protein
MAWRAVLMPCGVADGWGHATVHRQPGGACGVRAGAVGWGRGDEPGDGWLFELGGAKLVMLSVCVCVRMCACVCV